MRDQTIRAGAVKTRRRLVHNVQRVPTLQLGSQFNALPPPRELSCRLPLSKVIESNA